MIQTATPEYVIENDDYQIAMVTNGRLQQNAYIAKHRSSNDIVLIDPGGDFEGIRDLIDRMQGKPRLVLLTHAHFDHVGGVSEIIKHYDIPFYLHNGDAKLLRRAPLYAMSFESRVITVPKTFIPVNGTSVEWSGDVVKVIATPGHTDGSVCYLMGRLCFSGDTIMRHTVGNTNMPGASAINLELSINTLFTKVPANTLLLPGHDDPWSVADAKIWWAEKNAIYSR
jgi:hydroxyacylglutathione hydrolase